MTTRTLLLTDLVDSTALAERLGTDAAADLGARRCGRRRSSRESRRAGHPAGPFRPAVGPGDPCLAGQPYRNRYLMDMSTVPIQYLKQHLAAVLDELEM